jgi:integral membrane protein (TIGR01906 family)
LAYGKFVRRVCDCQRRLAAKLQFEKQCTICYNGKNGWRLILMKNLMRRVLPVVFAAALMLSVLTVSIGLPIYIRPFYYAHIDALALERSGFTAQQIRTAYDQVMDYLTLPGQEFGTGELAYSPQGKDHFVDCKVLFDLNATVLAASILCAVFIFALRRRLHLPSLRPAVFCAGIGSLAVPVVVGGLAAVDFESAFVIFHRIFFPGKDNWIFDYRADQIILVLPQEFFRNCAIFIGVGLLALSAGLIFLSRRKN